MSIKKMTGIGSHSYSTYILLLCIVIIVPFVISLSLLHYTQLSDELTENSIQLQKNTESSMIELTYVINKGLEIYDRSLDGKLKSAFEIYLAEYSSSGGELSDSDLIDIKYRLGERYNLYIFNESNVITKTTFKPDLGLDLGKIKFFSDYLDNIRNSDSYHGDRVVTSILDNSVTKKYGYMPSPDHTEILEISYDIEENDARSYLKYGDTAGKIQELNPNLIGVRFFDVFSDAIGTSGYKFPGEEETVSRIISSKSDYTYVDSKNLTTVNYRYIDLYNQEYASDISIVAAFEYDDSILKGNLTSLLISQIATLLLMLTLIIISIYLASVIMTRPVRAIVRDVDIIASGELKHQISANNGGREFIQLEKSIRNMVETLNEMIFRLKNSEEIIKEQNENLENLVEKRTSELKEANEEANFYLDLMTHDINNANMAALGYAEMLSEETEGFEAECSGKVKNAVKQSIRIINNVSMIRKIRDYNKALKPVSLSKTIDEALDHISGISPEYEKTDIKVLADELLTEVFVNLIENSKKYSEEKECRIKITAEPKGEKVLICIEDNGPGMPDKLKARCFERTVRGEGAEKLKSGRGLGLYIVRTLIEERYGGVIYAADRVSGSEKEGLKICFSLKKA
ncbi:HAMP domain-containing sensor histidine kinase [Methanoplanus limicola]|uniref:histidine kinase n=1 Tax=Methanoplanus limicola DSM 2279 TaxID=937775 RepID=H1Z165_9EURY|nr:HAMP domain-containing sensor histidine kinase [Methanoplanus limicola]EHQ35332.1 integral membrane sensor signal transduction histidine kinase [Methanoplanus limicola DSM 2279]